MSTYTELVNTMPTEYWQKRKREIQHILGVCQPDCCANYVHSWRDRWEGWDLPEEMKLTYQLALCEVNGILQNRVNESTAAALSQ